MIVVNKSAHHVRLACERCQAHTIVRRRGLSQGSWQTCPVCGATDKVAQPLVALARSA